jgi:hypothetical protein
MKSTRKAVDELNLAKKIISCHPSSLPLPDRFRLMRLSGWILALSVLFTRGRLALQRVFTGRRCCKLVAKRRNSRYEPGQRSGAWRKMRINRGPELRCPDLRLLLCREASVCRARTRNGFTPSSREQLFKKLQPLPTRGEKWQVGCRVDGARFSDPMEPDRTPMFRKAPALSTEARMCPRLCPRIGRVGVSAY